MFFYNFPFSDKFVKSRGIEATREDLECLVPGKRVTDKVEYIYIDCTLISCEKY